jgi:hypothetical protein
MSLLNYTDFLNESFLYEAAMISADWKLDKDNGKYRKQFLEFLDDPNKELSIAPDAGKIKMGSKYSFKSFKVKDIENVSDVRNAVESGADITSKYPMIKVNGAEVPLVHLQKGGVFITGGSNVTSTDVKEGMVTYFYYNQDLDFWDDLSVSVQAVNRIHGDALGSKALEEVKAFINSAEKNKKNIELINTWQSSAALLKPFSDAGFHINRDRMFNSIRAKGKSLSGMSAEDNWCPGDIYIYNPSALSGIKQAVNNATTIGDLNSLFNNNFEPISSNSHIGSVWAISLKQSEARVGKAKEWVVATASKDTIYNLTKEEQAECKKDINWGRKEIVKYQEMIKNFIKGSDITIRYAPDDVTNLKDDNVQSKLAAIKLTYHLITIPKGNAKDIDSNLLAVLKFGLKLSNPDVNPPYFKVIGNEKGGNASKDLYQGGGTLSLLVKGFDSKETMVSIVDRSTAKEILIYYYANKNGSAYEYKLKVGTAGNVQATVEYQDENFIGNLSDDPAGTSQKVIGTFNKRK